MSSGLHIFTTPRHRNLVQSRRRAQRVDGSATHLLEPAYHHDPITPGGALVTWDYGADFIELAERWSGYQTSVNVLHDRRLEIDGEFMDVFVMVKERR